MTISSQASPSLIDSVAQAESTRAEISVEVLRKAQNIEQEQGAAMVALLEKAGPAPGGNTLDVYA